LSLLCICISAAVYIGGGTGRSHRLSWYIYICRLVSEDLACLCFAIYIGGGIYRQAYIDLGRDVQLCNTGLLLTELYISGYIGVYRQRCAIVYRPTTDQTVCIALYRYISAVMAMSAEEPSSILLLPDY
jgi:hypothetical protein